MNSTATDPELIETQIDASSSLMQINKSEIEQQVATAKRYPRSVKRFIHAASEMACLSEDIAGECIYSLPRGGKPIEGPSARFAEIVANAWGNCRAGARVMDEDERFITAQGVFVDVENNVAITYEVKRRITDKNGTKYKDDMVGVTANAACSIALRNAILKGVPKAFWNSIYQKAKETAIGTAESLVSKRTKMMGAFAKMGVQPAQIFTLLEVDGEQDITLDHLAALRGTFTAIKEGDTTIDQAFSAPAKGGKVTESAINEKLKGKPPETTKPADPQTPAASDEYMCDEAIALEEKLNDANLMRVANLGLSQELLAIKSKLKPFEVEHLQAIVDRNNKRLK